jgi:flagellum-specific peptidoglycan hydrolase FlgJ
VDHTDFLLNRKHYAFLFDYARGDYKRWAKGLRKAGYATDPKYPDKLIATIEKYKFSIFAYEIIKGII